MALCNTGQQIKPQNLRSVVAHKGDAVDIATAELHCMTGFSSASKEGCLAAGVALCTGTHVGSMNLNTIEACIHGVASSLSELIHNLQSK